MVSMQQINQEIARQDWNSAELHLKQGLQEHPDSAKGWYFLAQVEGKLNHLGEAKNALEHADQIDPNHSYAGNLQTYNDLYNRVMVAQAVQTAPVQYTATVAQPAPVYTSGKVDTDHSGLWGFVGVAILAVMAYVFFKQWKKGKRDSMNIDRTPSKKVTVPASTSEASQPRSTVPLKVVAQVGDTSPGIINTPRRPAPPPVVREVRYAAPPPPYYPPAPPARSNTSTFVEGMIAGAVADEVVRSITKPAPAPVYTPPAPAPAPRDDFDYGSSSSSSSSSSFDYGSSSSSSSSDWGSSSSSFDSGSSSFDSGSSGSSDW